jgi:hypothetical protein
MTPSTNRQRKIARRGSGLQDDSPRCRACHPRLQPQDPTCSPPHSRCPRTGRVKHACPWRSAAGGQRQGLGASTPGRPASRRGGRGGRRGLGGGRRCQGSAQPGLRSVRPGRRDARPGHRGTTRTFRDATRRRAGAV